MAPPLPPKDFAVGAMTAALCTACPSRACRGVGCLVLLAFEYCLVRARVTDRGSWGLVKEKAMASKDLYEVANWPEGWSPVVLPG